MIDDFRALAERRRILGPRVLLQADEQRIDIQQGGQQAERYGPVTIVPVARVARPDKADPQLFTRTETVLPGLHKLRIERRQVILSGRNGVWPRAERERQAVDRNVQIERRHRGRPGLGQAMRNSVQARQQRTEFLIDDENDAGALRRQHRDVAHQMHHVPRALGLEHRNRLSRNRLLSAPHRGGYVWIGVREHRNFPARLTPPPAGLEVTAQQLKQGKIPQERGISAIDAHRNPVRLIRLTEASKLHQHERPVRGAADVRLKGE